MKSNETKKQYLAANLHYFLDSPNETISNQKELADAIGVTQTAVSYWVSGKKYPRAETLEKIANYFGISVSDLTDFDYRLKRQLDWFRHDSYVEQSTIDYTEWKLKQAETDAERAVILEEFKQAVDDMHKLKALEVLSTPTSPEQTKVIELDSLIACYSKLNDEGQSKVRSYAYDLSQNPNYWKSNDE